MTRDSIVMKTDAVDEALTFTDSGRSLKFKKSSKENVIKERA